MSAECKRCHAGFTRDWDRPVTQEYCLPCEARQSRVEARFERLLVAHIQGCLSSAHDIKPQGFMFEPVYLIAERAETFLEQKRSDHEKS